MGHANQNFHSGPKLRFRAQGLGFRLWGFGAGNSSENAVRPKPKPSVARTQSRPLFPFLGGLGSLISPFKRKRGTFFFLGLGCGLLSSEISWLRDFRAWGGAERAQFGDLKRGL